MKICILTILSVFLVLISCFGCAENSDEPETYNIPEGWLGNFDGKEAMTVDELRFFAKKNGDLTVDDFSDYNWVNFSSTMGSYNMAVSVEGGYRLHMLAEADKIITYSALERIWDGSGTGIDIRGGDIDKFIKDHPSNPSLTENEMTGIAKEYSGGNVSLIDLEWWDYEDEFPHNCKDPVKQILRESLENIDEPHELFITEDGGYVAISRKSGAVYIPEFDANGSVSYWTKAGF